MFPRICCAHEGLLVTFTPTWYLLQQEGFLAQACLCNGLTALRQANLGDSKGRFYSAFFELSIGLERVLKLVLILDHMARQQLQPPDTKTVKNYGHKLSALFNSAKTINTARGITALDDFPDDSLPIVMLHLVFFTAGRLPGSGVSLQRPHRIAQSQSW